MSANGTITTGFNPSNNKKQQSLDNGELVFETKGGVTTEYGRIFGEMSAPNKHTKPNMHYYSLGAIAGQTTWRNSRKQSVAVSPESALTSRFGL
jgi:hypothetical protein